MICPHCKEQFRLTWRRYFSTAFGKHLCPSCGTVSRLQWSFGYIGASAAVALMLFAALLAALSAGEAIRWEFLALWLFCWLLWLPLDRWFDEKLRKLKPVSK